MIDEVDRRLKNWISSIIDGIEISLEMPSRGTIEQKIGLYLIDIASTPPARKAQQQISLRYLVTTWAETPDQEHRLLSKLVFASMNNPEFSVQLEPPRTEVWVAFGLAPRPSFILQVPLRNERPEVITPLVREPLIIRSTSMNSLQGQVVGPQDIPIMGARVDLPTLQLSTHTDANGCFRFVTVPSGLQAKLLCITVKDRKFQIPLEYTKPMTSNNEPIVIHLPNMEG